MRSKHECVDRMRAAASRRARAAALAAALALPAGAAAHEAHDHEPGAASGKATGMASPAAASRAASPGAAGRAASSGTTGHAAVGAAAAPGAAGPRFAAASEQFELVGALDGRRLTLWLDRFADNVPLAGARIELEVGADKLMAQPAGDVYVAELPAAPAPGTLPVTASVEAGGLGDLLAAELVVPAAPSDDAAPAAATGLPAWAGRNRLALGAALAAAAAAGALGWTAARRRRA